MFNFYLSLMLKKINFAEKLTRTGGLVAGGVATHLVHAKVLPMVIGKQVDPTNLASPKVVDPKLANAITLGLGVVLPELYKPRKPDTMSSLIGGMGDGMAAASGVALAQALAPASAQKALGLGSVGRQMGNLVESEYIIAGSIGEGYAARQFEATVNGAAADKIYVD